MKQELNKIINANSIEDVFKLVSLVNTSEFPEIIGDTLDGILTESLHYIDYEKGDKISKNQYSATVKAYQSFLNDLVNIYL